MLRTVASWSEAEPKFTLFNGCSLGARKFTETSLHCIQSLPPTGSEPTAPTSHKTRLRAAMGCATELKFPESQANLEVQETRDSNANRAENFCSKLEFLFCFVVVLKGMLFQRTDFFSSGSVCSFRLCHNQGASPFPMPHLLPHL